MNHARPVLDVKHNSTPPLPSSWLTCNHLGSIITSYAHILGFTNKFATFMIGFGCWAGITAEEIVPWSTVSGQSTPANGTYGESSSFQVQNKQWLTGADISLVTPSGQTITLQPPVIVNGGRLNIQLAPTFYIAPSGNDSNLGTINSPFATIEKAMEAVRNTNQNMSGDIHVYLRGGFHFLNQSLNFTAADSGMNGRKVIYQSYPGENAIISGGRQISGWALHDASRNIYKATVSPVATRQFYVNCTRAVRARKGSGLASITQTDSGFTSYDASISGWNNPSGVEFVFNAVQGGTGTEVRWTERRCGVQSVAGSNITMRNPGWTRCRTDPWAAERVTTPTDIENDYSFLDSPGEWYLDQHGTSLYYIPRENIFTAQCIGPVIDGPLVSLNGLVDAPVRNIKFQNLTFAHATWLEPSGNKGFPEVQANSRTRADEHGTGNDFPPGAVSVNRGVAITFSRCVFKHLGATGLDLRRGSQQCEVSECVFTDISANCVKVGEANDPARSDSRLRDDQITIQNCSIYDAPCEFRGGVGILAVLTSNLKITNNELYNLPYTGISVGWGWNRGIYQPNYMNHNSITSNNIHHWGRYLSDVGAIYSQGKQPGSTWNSNYCHDMPYKLGADNMVKALYTDEGTREVNVFGNVIGGLKNGEWYSAWTDTIQDNWIHDNFTDTGNFVNGGTNNSVYNNTTISNGNWPSSAITIAKASGIKPEFQGVRSLDCGCSKLNSYARDGKMTQFHQFWINQTGRHFYTTSQNEGAQYFAYEGVVAHVFAAQVYGSVPLYRYNLNGIYFYTANGTEVLPGQYGFKLEGIQCYVLATQLPGTVPLYRYHNLSNSDYYYSTNQSTPAGYINEGVACYVYTN